MGSDNSKLPTRSSAAEVDAFLKQVAATPPPSKRTDSRGKLLFAMDATASREPSWDRACQIQAEMFNATGEIGGLDVKLCFYRGFREFYASAWCASADELLKRMTKVRCAGGVTQIARVLSYALKQTASEPVNAVVFVGDCMEESLDRLCDLAGQLGLVGVPVFVFQEGYDHLAERAFRDVARLSGGAYCRFDTGSSDQLKALLSAVAVYAAGGVAALEDFGKRHGSLVKQLGSQLGGGD